MSVKLVQNSEIPDEKLLSSDKHQLFILSSIDDDLPLIAYKLNNKLKRIKKLRKDLSDSPIFIELDDGGVASVVIVKAECTTFERHVLIRKAVMPLLEERPETLSIIVLGNDLAREKNACAAYYTTLVNAVDLPTLKKDVDKCLLKTVKLFGFQASHDYAYVRARVAGNTLCRQLSLTPPNQLTPAIYREKLNAFSQTHGWQIQTYDMATLKTMGAGAFVAVGQGSDPQDAAIMRLSYSPKNPTKHIALVGKGICFDTGGHNLKPAKYMQGMHEDMNGPAVALGILLAVTELQWPIKIDCWLAIAQNNIGPNAYKQNDVVTALNGMTIEIVHTDAEGRLVLADTLTLASREKPDLMLDFATLTGSMQTALTDRMSGVMSNRPELLCKAIGASNLCGERVVGFPFEADFDEELDSNVADIKQCTLDSDGDHLLAARFLSKFIEHDIPWLHTDLSSYARKGCLGAVQSNTTGFGVGFGLAFLQAFMAA
jgi:leucyl aminopeptidase